MPTIYFNHKHISFVEQAPQTVTAESIWTDETISIAKVLKKFETINEIVVIDTDRSLYNCFVAEFNYVEAAGGIVLSDTNKFQMIYIMHRWDLPKGHIDPGETPAQTAVREIAEETGVKNTKIITPLCNTMHAHNVYGWWELKRTYWHLHSSAEVKTAPQTEEDIEEAKWCTAEEVVKNLQHAYPTIVKVFRTACQVNERVARLLKL